MKDEPAFPGLTEFEQFDEDKGKYVTRTLPAGGMSLRDWFAGMALQGLLNCPLDKISYHATDNPFLAAEWAYQYADAMMKERVKERADET